MSKPTSTIPNQQAAALPKTLKVYTYNKLEFVLHPGGRPPRKFTIDWMKQDPASGTGDHATTSEEADEGYLRG